MFQYMYAVCDNESKGTGLSIISDMYCFFVLGIFKMLSYLLRQVGG
jgi:hypothetical protein